MRNRIAWGEVRHSMFVKITKTEKTTYFFATFFLHSFGKRIMWFTGVFFYQAKNVMVVCMLWGTCSTNNHDLKYSIYLNKFSQSYRRLHPPWAAQSFVLFFCHLIINFQWLAVSILTNSGADRNFHCLTLQFSNPQRKHWSSPGFLVRFPLGNMYSPSLPSGFL